ncbi:hypothetical protein J1792_27730 [Streptomyces triculaminicus]|uniref:SalK n=1 Tax=Streptomyces triculaminicus TaxID=2816232 RepID=A0A939JR97_9ACTN|nr:hypothetical protein [Streptomyces triculaminicus]MBO0656398.1 hypothetical protein [Streptomyces triculaminicus]
METLPEGAVRRCAHRVNSVHSTVYFSPDVRRELGALGVEHHRAVYFASRSAAFGRVGPGVVTATFHSFKHDLVAEHLPRVWDVVTPDQVLAARLRAADTTLRRVLGDELVVSPEMAEAAALALRAAEACERAARPLYSAHADLPVPDAPHLALWHATTLLREHRGDGHLMALTRAGLDPVEALVSHTAAGRGMSLEWLVRTRGWSMAELTAGQDRLRARGLLDADARLTEAGATLREELETETDRLDTAPYAHLGAAATARLTELVRAFTATAVAAGAFPADLNG